jgi:hypothetical protein
MFDLFSLNINGLSVSGTLGLKAIQSLVVSISGVDIAEKENVMDFANVKNLRMYLAARGKKRKQETVQVRGVFYPGVLLSRGWWERCGNNSANVCTRVRHKGGVHEWLQHGFEEWGPSWECSLERSEHTENYLLGQIGCEDEANSILLVVQRAKAEIMREEFLNSKGLFMAKLAKAVGSVCHVDDLSSETKAMLDERLTRAWRNIFDYCLYISSGKEKHTLEPEHGDAGIYSGYLWQCLYPKRDIKGGIQAKAEDAYFLWEHTNFANEEAIKFGIAALQRKRELLEKEAGDLVLLQRSAWRIEQETGETPLYKSEEAVGFVRQLLSPQ